MGGNDGILLTARGFGGFTVPVYFAGIMTIAREAGGPAGGCNRFTFTLAIMPIIGIVLVAIIKRPMHAVSE